MVLDSHLRPQGFGILAQETWEAYSSRLELPNHEPTRQFYRQVVYDHYEYFNDQYPWFVMDDYEFVSISLRADKIARDIRYFDGEPLNTSSFWHDQFDYFFDTQPDYAVFTEMMRRRTFPFPPIVLDPRDVPEGEGRSYGKPLHLIEGTHRVSYLTRMLELGLITGDSQHDLVLVQPASLAGVVNYR
jgi:hypothetical protein